MIGLRHSLTGKRATLSIFPMNRGCSIKGPVQKKRTQKSPQCLIHLALSWSYGPWHDFWKEKTGSRLLEQMKLLGALIETKWGQMMLIDIKIGEGGRGTIWTCGSNELGHKKEVEFAHAPNWRMLSPRQFGHQTVDTPIPHKLLTRN